MADVVKEFQIGTNNLVSYILKLGGVPIDLTLADEVEILIGNEITITRTASINGIDFNSAVGVVEINPALLSEVLTALKTRRYRVETRVKDPSNAEGALYGGKNTVDSLFFDVSIPVT